MESFNARDMIFKLDSGDIQASIRSIAELDNFLQYCTQAIFDKLIKSDSDFLLAERLAEVSKASQKRLTVIFDNAVKDSPEKYWAGLILAQIGSTNPADYLQWIISEGDESKIILASNALMKIDSNRAASAIYDRLIHIHLQSLQAIEALLSLLVNYKFPIPAKLVDRFSGDDMTWGVKHIIKCEKK